MALHQFLAKDLSPRFGLRIKLCSAMELNFVIFLVWVYAQTAFSTPRTFFMGHTVEYDIPPPPPSGRASKADVTTEIFSQMLNHFDPTETDRWSQRYYVNSEFYNSSNNVVFLMIGGEGAASIGWMTAGAWIETAEKYGALLFQLEHRYYGVSHPFTDLTTANLRYLSSRQALEDTATFITAMNERYNLTDPKWIAFGGSYAGSLAAWLRQKYPHLVKGAMSSSGPLFAQLDFPEYLDVVVQDLELYSDACVLSVKTAFDELQDLIESPENENLTVLFNFCDGIEAITHSDVPYLMEVLADNFAYIAQYNKNNGRETSVDDICGIMTNETYGSELYRLAEVNRLFYSTSCLDYRYQNALNELSDTTITASGNMRQWIYQTCTEYGWYQTSSQENPVFSSMFPIDFFTQICVDVFEFNATFTSDQIRKINTHFGGYDIDVQNVVFVHGSYDPWHPMGLKETTNPDSPVIFINGTAHCANMYDISENDLPQLTEARAEINTLIGKWLGVESSAAISRLSTSFLLLPLCILIFRH